MAVVYISDSDGVATGSSSALTVSHDPGAADMVVASIGIHRANKIISSIVYDPAGENVFLIQGGDHISAGFSYHLGLYYLLGASIVPGAKDFVLTPNSNSRMRLNVSSWAGVDQGAPMDGKQTADEISNVTAINSPTLVSGADDIVIDSFATNSNSGVVTADFGQIVMQNVNTNLGYGVCSRNENINPDMGYSWPTAREASILAMRIKAGVGGGGGNGPELLQTPSQMRGGFNPLHGGFSA